MRNPTHIFAGWLIDGSGGPIQKEMLIEIEEGFIHSVSATSPDQIRHIERIDSELLDLGHSTVIPGLIDTHVHIAMSGTDDPKIRLGQLNTSFGEVKDTISAHLRDHLAYGIVAVRDGGDKRGHALKYKLENIGKTPVRLQVAGQALHREGRYGEFLGRALPSNVSLADAIITDKKKVDHIKVFNSGVNSLKQFGLETPPQFQLNEMVTAVRAADRRGLPVMVHANGQLPVKIALDSGCQSIEHGFFMGRENLEKMNERGVTWVPTACTMKAYSEQLSPGGQESEISRKTLDHQLEQMAEAHRFNIPIALGTDAGSVGVHHGKAALEEMKLFSGAGFSIQETVRCATLNGARLLGLDKVGLLASGMEATLIAMKGEPDRLPDSRTRNNEFRRIKNIGFRKWMVL
jgi:imidazolonepropionase-like amidohydrolase